MKNTQAKTVKVKLTKTEVGTFSGVRVLTAVVEVLETEIPEGAVIVDPKTEVYPWRFE